MFYSKSNNGFFDPAINTVIPKDAREISYETYTVLLQGQSMGKVIRPGSGGLPTLLDPEGPTPEEAQAILNSKAREFLASTDWYVIRLQETGEPIPAEVLVSRQAARDSVI